MNVLFRKKFKLWDYLDEIDSLKEHDYIIEFENEGVPIKLYIPQYEDDWIQGRIANFGDFFEFHELSVLRTFIGDDKNILDIGANIGNHTVFFAKVCKANKIDSFEPIKQIYNVLEQNVMINNLEGIVTLHNCGLGRSKSNGRIKKYTKFELGSTQIEESKDGDIEILALDDFGFKDIDFIKIDVESFEYELLLGARKTLTENDPIVFMEIFEENLNRVDSLMNEYGYKIIQEVSKTNYLYEKKYE